MLSTIELKEAFGAMLDASPEILEVYSTPDFSFEQDTPNLTILIKKGFNVLSVWSKVREIYPEVVDVYVISNPQSMTLQGQRIIWRKGKWLV